MRQLPEAGKPARSPPPAVKERRAGRRRSDRYFGAQRLKALDRPLESLRGGLAVQRDDLIFVLGNAPDAALVKVAKTGLP